MLLAEKHVYTDLVKMQVGVGLREPGIAQPAEICVALRTHHLVAAINFLEKQINCVSLSVSV